jgi:hypothetical protein
MKRLIAWIGSALLVCAAVAFAQLPPMGAPVIFDSYALTDGATIAVDWGNARKQYVTMAGDRTITFSSPTEGESYILILCQDGTGTRVPTWGTGATTIKWSNGAEPTLTTTGGDCDAISLQYINSTYHGTATREFSDPA